MHARVVLGKVRMHKQEEAIRLYKETVLPTAAKQKGFISGNLLTDPDTNKFISITIWETEKDMLSSEASGYLQEQLDRIAALFVGPPSVQHYVVTH